VERGERSFLRGLRIFQTTDVARGGAVFIIDMVSNKTWRDINYDGNAGQPLLAGDGRVTNIVVSPFVACRRNRLFGGESGLLKADALKRTAAY